MENKNLKRKILANVSKCLAGIALLGLTACATPLKQSHRILNSEGKTTEMYLEKEAYEEIVKKERYVEIPTQKGFYVQREQLSKEPDYSVLDSEKKKTGMSLEEGLYKKISNQKKIVEIPTQKGFYVQIGQDQSPEQVSAPEKKIRASLETRVSDIKVEDITDKPKIPSENKIKLTEEKEVKTPIEANYEPQIKLSGEKRDKAWGEIPEPIKVDYETSGNGYFHVFDKEGRETGVYLEEGLYKEFSREKEEGASVEIPNHKGLYIKAGQGRATAIWNSLLNGGGYMHVYSNGKPLDGFYVSEPTIRDVCYKRLTLDQINSGEQIYDGRLKKIPKTSLELKCAVFDGIKTSSSDCGGGDGGNGSSGAGNGGASGGGGQGSGGGNSGGAR